MLHNHILKRYTINRLKKYCNTHKIYKNCVKTIKSVCKKKWKGRLFENWRLITLIKEKERKKLMAMDNIRNKNRIIVVFNSLRLYLKHRQKVKAKDLKATKVLYIHLLRRWVNTYKSNKRSRTLEKAAIDIYLNNLARKYLNKLKAAINKQMQRKTYVKVLSKTHNQNLMKIYFQRLRQKYNNRLNKKKQQEALNKQVKISCLLKWRRYYQKKKLINHMCKIHLINNNQRIILNKVINSLKKYSASKIKQKKIQNLIKENKKVRLKRRVIKILVGNVFRAVNKKYKELIICNEKTVDFIRKTEDEISQMQDIRSSLLNQIQAEKYNSMKLLNELNIKDHKLKQVNETLYEFLKNKEIAEKELIKKRDEAVALGNTVADTETSLEILKKESKSEIKKLKALNQQLERKHKELTALTKLKETNCFVAEQELHKARTTRDRNERINTEKVKVALLAQEKMQQDLHNEANQITNIRDKLLVVQAENSHLQSILQGTTNVILY